MKHFSRNAATQKLYPLANVFSAMVVCAGLLVPGMVSAAPVATRLPGVIDRPPVELPPSLSEEKAEVPSTEAPRLAEPADSGEVVATISKVQFEGTLIFKEKQLQAVVSPYLNQPLTRGGLARLKYDLTKYYYDRGYVLVKVTTPPQNLSAGVMKVVIIAGRIGGIDVSNDVLRASVVKHLAEPIKSGDVFNERTVESAMQDINEISNVRANLNLRPGREVGTTDLRLNVEKADEDIQQVSIDNYGSELTGEKVARVDLRKSNLLGYGETFGFSGRKSNEDFWSTQVNSTIPLPVSNLKLEADYLYSENDIGDFLSALNSSGKSQRAQVAVSSALVNQRQRKAVVRGGVEWGKYQSYLFNKPETSDTLSKLFVEASYTLRASRFISFVSVRISKGVDVFDANSRGDAGATRIDGDPRSWILRPLVYMNLRVTPKDFLEVIAEGQASSRTLLASDLFAIGGYGSVRGFEPAQATGENGVSININYNHQFNVKPRWFIEAGPFVDIGLVDNKKSNSTVEDTLNSAGLGAEFLYKHSDKLTSKLRLDWAHLLDDRNLPLVNENTIYARYTQTF